jgi:hypothetical protein
VASRVVTAFLVVLMAGCSKGEEPTTVCWLGSEMPAPPESTGSDGSDREKWRDYWRSGFFHCAEDRAYQVIQLGDGGELAKAAALKDCTYHWVPNYKSASYRYHEYFKPSATAEALEKLASDDVEKLLNDFSTQIEVFKLCYAKGIKSPSWN